MYGIEHKNSLFLIGEGKIFPLCFAVESALCRRFNVMGH